MAMMTGTMYTIVIDVVNTNSQAQLVSIDVDYFNVDEDADDNYIVKRILTGEHNRGDEVQPGDRFEVKFATADVANFGLTLSTLANIAGSAVLSSNVAYWSYYD